MKVGTKSLLFGCHQFALHPIFVLKAWNMIYRDTPKPGNVASRLAAAVVHDWGYWGCETMDGNCGDQHPILGANLIYHLTGNHDWYEQLICHSRFFSNALGLPPSNFCWIDKLAAVIMPTWLWASLAYLTGEGWEYLSNPEYSQYAPGTPMTFKSLVTRHRQMREETIQRLNAYGWMV